MWTTVPRPGTIRNLANRSDEATGDSTASLAATIPEDAGNLYWYVSTSPTAPSASDLKAGTGAARYGQQALTGAQAVSVAGLTPETTYYGFILHRDSQGTESVVASASSFVTDGSSDGTSLDFSITANSGLLALILEDS